MKIIAVLGSPQPRGNSAGLARAFLAAVREQGAEVQEYQLNQLNFKGCQGCRACKNKKDACTLEDDLTTVLEAIKAADLLVLASPVYFGDLSGQMKCFFDRTFSFFNPDFSSRLPGGKQAVLLLAQGNPDPGQFADIFPRYERWLKFYGFATVHLLRAVGVRDPGDIATQPDLLSQAAALARKLAAA
ncbi:MAG: flavodoxin family protein [Thermodesulfobacteriota bacterium]